MKQPSWATLLGRNARLLQRAAQPLRDRAKPPPGAGSWARC
ncbi:hypothetical protein [Pelomonas sp. Root1444]|nr:hypothetical protein [Pelomonas sp. Root1444]